MSRITVETLNDEIKDLKYLIMQNMLGPEKELGFKELMEMSGKRRNA